MVVQDRLTIATSGRGTIPVTDIVLARVRESGINTGLCHLFLHHTSASLVLCENADPDVRTDLDRFMARLVPDGDALFEHTAEGADDMPAHIRSIMSGADLTLPVADGACDLGTWQGVYLWEHRTSGHRRRMTITIYGERR
jgi:secondary thiamine-phosphate synthase enzyme